MLEHALNQVNPSNLSLSAHYSNDNWLQLAGDAAPRILVIDLQS